MADLEKIRGELKKQLKKERYIHTIGVMYTAASMAMRYGEDIEKAMTAGLLHDCGKFAPAGEQIRLCKKYGLSLKESEVEMPALIHAKLGAYLAKETYKVCDGEILNAILYHTTGRPDMTMLEKIVFLADYIEPGRKMIPGLSDVRSLAFTNINRPDDKRNVFILQRTEKIRCRSLRRHTTWRWKQCRRKKWQKSHIMH